MRQFNNRTSKLMVFGVIVGDLILMNTLFTILYHLWLHASKGPIFSGGYCEMVSFNTLCYIASTYYNSVVLHLRKTRRLNIIAKVTKNCAKFAIISIAFIALAGYDAISTRFMILFHFTNYILLIIWRIICHRIVLYFRSHGRNSTSCIYLGSSSSIRELYAEQAHKSTGYRVLGYFDDEPDEKMNQDIPYLGKLDTVIEYLDNHRIDNIYSSLPSSKSQLIMQTIHWSEQNFAHFFHVSHMRNYLHHRMTLDTVGDVPVLSLHASPLNDFDNRLIKRTFDLVMSGLFL